MEGRGVRLEERRKEGGYPENGKKVAAGPAVMGETEGQTKDGYNRNGNGKSNATK